MESFLCDQILLRSKGCFILGKMHRTLAVLSKKTMGLRNLDRSLASLGKEVRYMRNHEEEEKKIESSITSDSVRHF